ncbi:MAG: transposase, partial [Aeromonas sp.]
KRARTTVKMAYRQPPKGRITDLVIDSTGLNVFGEGEWKVRKHGAEKRRVWRKLHLAVEPVTHWQKGHPRNEAVQVMRKEGLAHWKKISGYHRRSLAETAMFRFKQLMAGQITLRKYNAQVGEVMAYVSVINKLNTLGLSVRKPRL